MLGISLRVGWLVCFSCLILAAGLGAAGGSGTYLCPGTNVRSALRLDEVSIEGLNALQASGLVKSLDLVHARNSFSIYLLLKAKRRRHTFNVSAKSIHSFML